jgi:hypothetical protein
LFLSRYGASQAFLKPMLDAFGPDALRQWARGLGIETFIGSSLRIFPREMKAAPLLRAWMHRLRVAGVKFNMRHRWQGCAGDDFMQLRFATPGGIREIRADAVILAMGGASWPSLGSTGAWSSFLKARDILVEPFIPSNCGFKVDWSDHFRSRNAGEPVKSVVLSASGTGGKIVSRRGEFVITEGGVEGSLVYALSSLLREQIGAKGEAVMSLDLMPDRDVMQLASKLSVPRGKQSFANYLRKRMGLDGVKAALLRELMPDFMTFDAAKLAAVIKALPLRLTGTASLEEAISTGGGVSLIELDSKLMLRKLPGVFCAGEMLAWDAPTGGYLLTACFATGRQAGLGALEWLKTCPSEN